MPGALGRLRQSGEHIQAFREIRYSFHMGGALAGVLARLVPEADGWRAQARLGVVMRQQFGLGRGGVWKLRLQHLGNLPVVLLPRALEQRLVCRVLDQGVLEDVGGLRWHAALIEHFRVDEPAQFVL